MVAVHSLGLHKPSALDHLITEGHISQNADPNVYDWEVSSLDGLEEELLVTKHCVAWSQGRVLRKLFNVSFEGQEIQHAKLAWFDDDKHQYGARLDEAEPMPPNKASSEEARIDEAPSQKASQTDARARALVILLKQQAHIHFLSGASYVVNLPFEVEKAFAAPKGLILQRKLRRRPESPGNAPEIPAPPQNSFFSSRTRSMQNRPMSTMSPAQSSPPPGLNFENLQSPDVFMEDELPRHYSLSNSTSEIALLVRPIDNKASYHANFNTSFESLDLGEDIVYVSTADETRTKNPTFVEPLTMMVTRNLASKNYSLWRATYANTAAMSEIVTKLQPRRHDATGRSSSFVTTGTATPVARNRISVRQSMGAARSQAAVVEQTKARPTRKSSRNSKVSKSQEATIAAQMNPEYQSRYGTRDSRRVSSMLSRADLNASFDHHTFQDLAAQSDVQTSLRKSLRRGQSLGPADRRSFAGGSRGQLRASTPGTFSELSLDDLAPNESQTVASFGRLTEHGTAELQQTDENVRFMSNSLHGLKKEVIVHKFASVPFEAAVSRPPTSGSFAGGNANQTPIVLSVASHVSITEESELCRKFYVAILEKNTETLIQIEYEMRLAGGLSTEKNTPRQVVARPFLLNTTYLHGISDACTMSTQDQDYMMLLKREDNTDSNLYIYSPWSQESLVKVTNWRFRIFNPYDTMHLSPHRVGVSRTTALVSRLTGIKSGGNCYATDLIMDDGKRTQIKLMLWPKNRSVQNLLSVCLSTLPFSHAEKLLKLWWNRNAAYRKCPDGEWHAFAVALLAFFIACEDPRQARSNTRRHATDEVSASSEPRRDALDKMHSSWNSGRSTKSPAWTWASAEPNTRKLPSPASSQGSSTKQLHDASKTIDFSNGHIKPARAFVHSPQIRSTVAFMQKHRSAILPQLPLLVTAVHIYREESKLSDIGKTIRSGTFYLLAPLIMQLARWINWQQWTAKESSYYAHEPRPIKYDFEDTTLYESQSACRPVFVSPPSIRAWMDAIGIDASSASFPTFTELFASKTRPAVSRFSQSLLPRISALNANHERTRHGISTPADLVRTALSVGIKARLLESSVNIMTIKINEVIAQTQLNPPHTCTLDMLEYISRQDLARTSKTNSMQWSGTQSTRTIVNDAAHDLHSISQNVELLDAALAHVNNHRMAVARLIFSQDRRLAEAIHMIEPYRVAVAQCVPEIGWSESQILEAQREVHNWVMIRTFALAPGLAFAHYDSKVPLLSEKFNIHGYNTLCIMKPMNNTVSIDRAMFTEEKFAWAWFHSGVAAGLSISRSAGGIDSSWMVFNRPTELNNRHAGLLLALGLNGHLKNMAKWLAFKYLTPKHAMTSTGLLLGLSASFLGTMDTLITRLLSVHITRMLPVGAAELNLSPLTQAAGLMGVGLLYCDTQHRRMSEIMLSEIEILEAEDTSSIAESYRDESYRLAAGFALGFINLGLGRDLRGLHDLRLVERLLTVAVGPKPVGVINLMDQATAGAVIALAFIFMKTNDQAVANKIDIPDTVPQFDFVRPDMLLLRTLAKHLIMWNRIQTSHDWIRHNLPREYRKFCTLQNVTSMTSKQMPFYNILAGLLWAVSLKAAGSGDQSTRDFLVGYLDQFIRICRLPAEKYDAKLTRNTVRNCQDLVALACATVMSGTGDLILFRRLRLLHGRVNPDTTYGSHMAAHMAIGVLFFGAGSYTFGTTNLAIASLIVAFYPVFPMDVNDNKAHLQAFRHLWTLAAESRCLVVRDLDSNRIVPLDVMLNLRDGTAQRMTTPRLLPDLTSIKSSSTIGTEYWPVALDLSTKSKTTDSFKRNAIIQVRRRPPHEAHTSAFTATLIAINDSRSSKADTSDWLFSRAAFSQLEKSDTSIFMDAEERGGAMLDMRSSAIDARLSLALIAKHSWNRDALWGLRALFRWADKRAMNGEADLKYVRKEVLDMLKAELEKRARSYAVR